ncbi:MAG: MBL fold metallo-hydrolase [Bacteroidales bacterium]|jgi:ribonuclease J
MNFKIHRGTKEIGGSCVEVWTQSTRILLDFGMPLVEKDGSEFNSRDYENLPYQKLVEIGVLPNVKGLYDESEPLIDAVIISHPHKDHYGLTDYIHKNVQFYMGKATHELIKISNIFTRQNTHYEKVAYFEKEETFKVGDISITPYWADHSAFDAYMLLVEANGKSLFYSGDFRGHGRKEKVFKWFTHNAPKGVDYLLLEGTTIGRNTEPSKTEEEIENELVKLFKQPDKINLVYTSGQNLDRLVSVYKACLRTKKIMVVDVYVATILEAMSNFGEFPYPSEEYGNIKVMFPYKICRLLNNGGNEKIMFQFKPFKITREQINEQYKDVVFLIRDSMKPEIDKIPNINGGNFIYSMWEGYLQKEKTKKFVDDLLNRDMTMHKIHTSGHADIETLIKLAKAVEPKYIVPIHTFNRKDYAAIFPFPVVEANDGETITIN